MYVCMYVCIYVCMYCMYVLYIDWWYIQVQYAEVVDTWPENFKRMTVTDLKLYVTEM